MITRRKMLLGAAAAGGAVTFSAVLPGLRAAAQATVPLRRSLQDMDLDDPILDTLREFVTMMKDPARDGQPLSWVGFSNVHGSLAGGFNLCPHGNWYFLPWHRAYIRSYEQAARAVTGVASFAMPYWDWTAQPDFPAAFGDPTFDGAPNPLFVPGRFMQTGDEMPPSVTGPDVMDEIYGNVAYEEFGSSRAPGQNDTDPSWIMARGTQGTLEFNPHNNVHCDVGGPFMCSGASPQDPIFQMHHCNIDRIWAQWISLGRENSSSPLWLDMAFTDNFINPDGKTYTDVVSQLLEVEPLGYTYGLEPPSEPGPVAYPGRDLYLAALYGAPLATAAAPELGARLVESAEMVASPDDPLSVAFQPSASRLGSAVSEAATAALETARLAQPKVYAFVRLMNPSDAMGTQLRVFANLPEATPQTPTSDPHFVTSIGFFGPSGTHDGHDMRPSAAVDLTPALRRVGAADEITVQLVPVAQHGEDRARTGSVSVAEIELAIV